MYCENCGNKLIENANYCKNCGNKKRKFNKNKFLIIISVIIIFILSINLISEYIEYRKEVDRNRKNQSEKYEEYRNEIEEMVNEIDNYYNN